MNLNSSKKIYQKILKGLNDMPLKELMSSKGYYGLLRQLSNSMLLRKNEVIFPYFRSIEDGSTGCTNGTDIFINTWSPMALSVEKFKETLEGEDKPNWLSQLPTRVNVQQYSYLVNTGLVCHEFAHVLYTDFYELAIIRKESSEGDFASCSNKEKLEKIFDSKFKNSLINNIRFLTNAVEDGYIENCLALEYPNNGTVVRGLQATRDMLFFSSPSLYETEDKVMKGKFDIPSLFCNLILLQVRGFIPKDIEKCSGELHKLLMEALEEAKPYVDDYLKSSQRHKENILALIDIMANLYPDSKESEEEENQEENQSSNSQNDDSSSEEENNNNDDSSSSNADSDSESSSSNEDADETESSNDGGSDADKGEENSNTDDDNSDDNYDDESEDDDDYDDDEENNEESSPSIKETQNPADEEETDAGRKKMGFNDDELNNSSRSSLRNPTSEMDEDELKEKQEEVDKVFENAKNDSSSSQSPDGNSGLKDMAQIIAEEEIQKSQNKDLMNNLMENQNYFVRKRSNVISVQQYPCLKGDKETYDTIYKSLEPTIKACVRKIQQVLKKREFDDEETGFSSGQRLVGRELYRQDRKVFSKDLVPDETPDVAFSIMVDESGSMEGDKIIAARQTAILFDAVARKLNIPTRIVGHDENNDIVNVRNYRNFISSDKEKYSLVNLCDRWGNIDTMVLTGLCEEMLKREERSKVVIVISDGLPCGLCDSIQKDNFKGVPLKKLDIEDSYYSNDYEMQELNACIRYYRKKGIKLIGVAIDQQKFIKAIYEEGVLDCTDLNKLPIEMLKLFKKYVLK